MTQFTLEFIFMFLRLLSFLICLTISSLSWGMGTIFIKPASILPKSRFATPGLNSFEFQAVRSKAKDSFNECEKKVPLLSFHGAEDLLNRFIDPKLPCHDTSKVGQAFFSGTLTAYEYGFTFGKNFNEGIFFFFEGSIANYVWRNICPIPVSTTGRCLSEEEINQDTALTNYLSIFEQKFLSDSCEYAIKQIGPLAFTLGYAKNWQHFEHADYVDFSIQTGLWVPSQNINEINKSEPQTFLPPTNSKVSFGIPVQASFEAGFYEWLNIGATGIVIPFISNNVMVRLNPTPTNNILLSNNEALTKVQHYPMIYFDAYLAAEELCPKTYFLLGFSYTKQFKTTYATCDPEKYPVNVINEYGLTKPWEIFCITFEAAVNFATKENLTLPALKFIYVHPLYGKAIYNSSLVAGQFKIELSGQF